jgi:flagellar motor switch protein FliG
MDKQCEKLYKTLEEFISGEMTEDKAVEVLASFSKDDYTKLIEVVKLDKKMPSELQDQIVGVFSAIRDLA